jgi:hypothetical protein
MAGHVERFLGSTGPEQQAPPVVTLAAGQQVPPLAGI